VTLFQFIEKIRWKECKTITASLLEDVVGFPLDLRKFGFANEDLRNEHT